MDARCVEHDCCAVERRECQSGERYPVHPLEQDDARHIIMPCTSAMNEHCSNPAPVAATTPSPLGARPGLGDPAAGCNGYDGTESRGSDHSSSRIMETDESDGWASAGDRQLDSAFSTPSPGLSDGSLESDLFSMSDVSDNTPSVDQSNPMLPALRDAFVNRLLARYQAHLRSATSGSRAAGSTSITMSLPSTSSGTSGQSHRSNRRQRPSDEADDDDSPSGPPPPKRPKHIPASNPPQKRLLACPFWKANPSLHRCCASKTLTRIRDVKQHLTRYHKPDHYCNRCKSIFQGKPALTEHVSNPAGLFCVPSPHLNGITPDQQTQLSRKSNKALSEEAQWFVIWSVVFPDLPRPVSAYIDERLSQELGRIREYCSAHGATILQEAAREVMARGEWPGFQGLPDEEREDVLTWCAREGTEAVFSRFAETVGGSEGGVIGQCSGVVLAQHATPTTPSKARPDGVDGVGGELFFAGFEVNTTMEENGGGEGSEAPLRGGEGCLEERGGEGHDAAGELLSSSLDDRSSSPDFGWVNELFGWNPEEGDTDGLVFVEGS